MKRLFERIFKKESQLNYIIAEYHPIEMNLPNTDARLAESTRNEPANIKEIQVDKAEKLGID